MKRALLVVVAGVLIATPLLRHVRSPNQDARQRAQGQLKELASILKARNDNDPRLDKDFDSLSPSAKELFRNEYRRLPLELRNERGTIVYLLGRNLAEPEDWAFFREVAAEPPCLSLADCGKKASGPAEPGDEVTLAYPSLVALRQASRSPDVAQAMSVIEAAKKSQVPAVVRLADKLSAAH